MCPHVLFSAFFPDLVNNRTNASQCVKNGSEPGCSHTVFPLHNIEYTHVCGVVEGQGYGTPDGFCTQHNIDGVRTNVIILVMCSVNTNGERASPAQ